MKTFTRICCFLFATIHIVNAQTTFQKLIYSKGLIALPAIAPANTSDFVITGAAQQNLDPAVVALLDKNGNTKWYHYYSDDVNSFDYPQTVQTKDSGFILMNSPLSNYPVLIKLDKAGNVLWSKFLTSKDGNALYPYALTADGTNVLITGHYTDSTGDHPVLMKIDAANGKIIFAKSLSIHRPGNKQSEGYSLGVTQTNDNGYMVCGWSSYFAGMQNHVYMFMAKFDNNGNYSWAKVYNDSSELISVVQAKGGFIFTGDNNDNPCYLKTDSKGNIVWSYKMTISRQSSASGIVRNANGSYTFVANQALTNITEDGKINWYKKANYYTSLSFSNLITAGNNSTVAISKNYFFKDTAIIFKFDSNGNTCNGSVAPNVTIDSLMMQAVSPVIDTADVIGSFTIQQGTYAIVQKPFYNTDYCNNTGSNITAAQQKPNNLTVSVSPNPVTGSALNCTIQNAKAGNISIAIINTEGRTFFEETLLGGSIVIHKTIDISKLMSGVYTLKVTDGVNQASIKFIKE